MDRLLAFALVGFAAQLVDGALGMAYGVTASSLLLATGTSAATASASVHLAEVGTTLASGLAHWRHGNVSWRTVRWLALPGALAAFVGATLLAHLDGGVIKPWVSGLLLALGAWVLVRFALGVQRQPLPPEQARPRFLAPLGALGGFVDAIGGGGWGPITTPALLTLGRLAPRTAIGSVSAAEFVVALAASVGFLASLGHRGLDPALIGGLLLGGVAVAPLAAWLVRRLAPALAGTLVGLLLVLTNLGTLLTTAGVADTARRGVLLVVAVAGVPVLVRVARAGRLAPAVPAASQA